MDKAGNCYLSVNTKQLEHGNSVSVYKHAKPTKKSNTLSPSISKAMHMCPW